MIRNIRVLENSVYAGSLPAWYMPLRAETTHLAGAAAARTVLRSVFPQNLKTAGQECWAPAGAIAGIRRVLLSDSFLTPSVNNALQVDSLRRTLSPITGISGIDAIKPVRLVEFDGALFNSSLDWTSNTDTGEIIYETTLTINLGRQGTALSTNAVAIHMLQQGAVSAIVESNQGVRYFIGGTVHRLNTTYSGTTGTEATDTPGYTLTLTAKSHTPPLVMTAAAVRVGLGGIGEFIIDAQTACTVPIGSGALTTESPLPFPTNPAACRVTTYRNPTI